MRNLAETLDTVGTGAPEALDQAPVAPTDSSPTACSAPQPFLLASLLVSYPDADFPAFIHALFDDEYLEAEASAASPTLWEDAVGVLEHSLLNADRLDELRSEYIDLFDRGTSSNPLYHSEYGRDRAMRKTAELVDLAGFYQAFGFEFGQSTRKDMLDHLAIELEFYALMLMKEAALVELGNQEGQEIVRDARLRFLKEHLGSFPGAVSRRPGVAASPLYGPILRWCALQVEAECRKQGVVPLALEWLAGQQADEVVACGNGSSPCTPASGIPV